MNFIKTSFLSGISTFISLIVKLITNKVVAVYLGTNGMFLLGQLKDFMRISETLSHMGTTSGTIKYVAEYKDDPIELTIFLGTGLKIHLGFSFLVCLFTFLFREELSVYLFQSSDYKTFITVLGFSIISLSVHTLFMSILNGLKRIKLYVTITVISTILTALILIFLVLRYKVIGAFYAFAINQFLVLLISFLLIMLFKPFLLSQLWSTFNQDVFKKLSKFSLMALTGPICAIAATFFVRYFLANRFDQNHAGSWEGMWRISAMYLLFLTTTFKFYLIPTFSVLKERALKQEVFKIWRFMLPVIIVITAVIYMLRDFVITTLLDKEFFLVGTLIGFHLLGDTIKINGWVLGNILIAKAKTKAFIFFQVEWALVFASLTYLLVGIYGFIGVSIAYFLAYLVHFILMNIYFRKLLWLK